VPEPGHRGTGGLSEAWHAIGYAIRRCARRPQNPGQDGPGPGRCRSEAAFAALGGTSPIPASSGMTVRHRLNRGGDRALNRAIHAIALVRMRSCPRTRAYVTRRTAEGKTAREIRRCLKRYIARELYRQLTRTMNLPAGP